MKKFAVCIAMALVSTNCLSTGQVTITNRTKFDITVIEYDTANNGDKSTVRTTKLLEGQHLKTQQNVTLVDIIRDERTIFTSSSSKTDKNVSQTIIRAKQLGGQTWILVDLINKYGLMVDIVKYTKKNVLPDAILKRGE